MSKLDINIFNKEIAFGLTTFDTIYFENKTPHFLYKHYSRLKRASKALKILFKYSFEEFEGEVIDFLNDQSVLDGVLKVVVLNNSLHFNIRQPSYSIEKYEEGFRLSISKVIRDERNIINYFKTFNYGINIIEDNRAKDKGYDGVVFLNSKKQVCETSYANIFFREGKTLYTPHLSSGMLKGIMRDQVIRYSRLNGFNIIKGFITLEKLSCFKECFITNSVAGIFPVKSIGDIEFTENDFCKLINKERYFIRSWNKG
jgi:4-amino-4-deoxychorismate lyase